MANFSRKIVFLALFFCLTLANNFSLGNENIPKTELKDYDSIYNSLQEADFDYIFGIDPYQTEEYKVHMHSPYPLFRSGVNLIFKSKIIPPGYYLLTPREKNGKTWILFKENGRVSFVIPTYNEDIVLEDFYEDKLPHPNKNTRQKISSKFMEFIGNKFDKQTQRKPIPQAYIDFDDVGNYWNMILYYGNKKYYLIFKKD